VCPDGDGRVVAGRPPGSLFAASVWTVLQVVGVLRDAPAQWSLQRLRDVRHRDRALVWIYFGGQVTLYVAEINMVHKEPVVASDPDRAPLSEADKPTYERAATGDEGWPEEDVDVSFDSDARLDSAG
jgi:hypothetical protein